MTVRLRLDIAYDGTEFSGWAVQPGRRTVAGVIGDALATLFRAPVPMVVAGRTDAGVHAIGQVAHIDVDPQALVGLAPRHLAGARAVSEPAVSETAVSGLAVSETAVSGLAVSEPAVSGRAVSATLGLAHSSDRVREGSPGGQRCAGSAGAGRDGCSSSEGSVSDLVQEGPPGGQMRAGSAGAGAAGATVVPNETTAGLVGLRRRLAGLLPSDVRVRGIQIAPFGFDARFSALRRHYRYRVADTDWGVDPMRRADTLAWRHRLDPGPMQAAANLLLGLRDFAAYCKPRDGATTIRDLQLLTVTAGGDRATDGAGLLLIDVTADAFCHSMVRSLVGALLAVGEGRTAVERPAELLAAGRRTAEIAVAPAHGLTLMGVDYPPDADLVARAAQTRALRGPHR